MSEKIYEIISGENHMFLLTKQKHIYGLGNNDHGQLGLPNIDMTVTPYILPFSKKISVSRIYVGTDFSFCISQHNQVYSWGLNIKGQLGLGHYENMPHPTLVKTLSHFKISGKKSENKKCILKESEVIVDIACGALHTLALTNKSKVYSSGFGENYSLGHNSNKTLTDFKEISFFHQLSSNSSHKIDKICCGTSHSGALIAGKVYLWGTFANSKYCLNKTPIAINLKKEIADFVLGDLLTVLLTKNGEIFTLGENIDFQLGVPKISNYNTTHVTLPCKIEYICCGLNHVIAINNSRGRIFGWGSNKFGQIHPLSSDKVFKNFIELPWMTKSNAYIITCGPLNTILVSAKKAVVPRHGKGIEDLESIAVLQKQIETMKKKAQQMNIENIRLKEELTVLHSTVNSHMDSYNASSNGDDENLEPDCKYIFKVNRK
jgi:mitogen-activated protein kinase kinase kinase 9